MRATLLLALAILGVAAWGCDGWSSSQLPGRAGNVGQQWPEPVASRKTTTERIAVLNLNAAIESSRRNVGPHYDISTVSTLVEHLMLRADFYRNFDDWEEARAVSLTALDAHPDDPTALLLHARVLATLHEFDRALELVVEARRVAARDVGAQLSNVETQAQHLQTSIGLARESGAEVLIDERRALARAFPTYQHVAGLALALAESGEFDEADAAFRRALEGYRDVSPFPFAWVAFQRGVMWSEQAGRPDLGRILYEEALAYLPGYVLANVHLAELDALDGDVEAAIARVRPLIDVTQDPEPLSLLANLVPAAFAGEYADRADAAYRALIERFPKAFAHHVPDD